MQAIIDRIEGSTAVLLCGPEEILLELPVTYLPEGSREGTVLQVTFRLDEETTKKKLMAAKERIKRLKQGSSPAR